MLGQMMQQPLLISSLIVHAERHHPEREIVSRRVEGDLHRTTYRELALRSRRMAKALAALGMLNPVIAGAAMAMSSVSVVSNSLLLKNWKPNKD